MEDLNYNEATLEELKAAYDKAIKERDRVAKKARTDTETIEQRMEELRDAIENRWSVACSILDSVTEDRIVEKKAPKKVVEEKKTPAIETKTGYDQIIEYVKWGLIAVGVISIAYWLSQFSAPIVEETTSLLSNVKEWVNG